MADEVRKVISIDTEGAVNALENMKNNVENAGQSFKTLKEAKAHLDSMKASLLGLEEGTSDYNDKVKEITGFQEKLNKAVKGGASSADNAEGSYNALNAKMKELQKQWKATGDEAERDRIGEQIVSLNDKLKGMDASIGNYQRNVGNYENAFTSALGNISSSVSKMNNPLAVAKSGVMALGQAFKALIMNPVGAVIMAITVALKALQKGFAGSETASNALKRAFAALEPITNTISNILTGMATVVGNLAEKWIPKLVSGVQSGALKIAGFLNKLGLVSDEKLASFRNTIEESRKAVEKTTELTDREIRLEERKRKQVVESAKAEMQLAELRNKADDKQKYNDEQRRKYTEQAIALERKQMTERLSIAQEEYDIMLEKSKLTDNDRETNDRLAEAEANLYNVRKEYFDKTKELNAKLNEISGSVKTEEVKVQKELSDAEKKAVEQREKNLDKIRKIQTEALQETMDSSEKEIDILRRKYEEEKSLLEKYGEDTTMLTEAYNRNIAKVLAGKGEKKVKDIDDESSLARDIADKTITIESEKNLRLLEIDRQRIEDKKAVYEQLAEIDNLDAGKKEEYYAKLKELNADLIENDRLTAEAKKEIVSQQVDVYTQMAEGIGSIMGDVSSIWQDSIKERQKNGKITEQQAKKEFEMTKKMQIAQAVINGLAGMASAISSPSYAAMGIPGIVLAAIHSASIATTTAVQIAKIRSTQFESASGSGSESVSSSSVSAGTAVTDYTPTYTANITGQRDTEELANTMKRSQEDVRVYVLESDISEAGKKVEIRESESTF